jgi:hypothetical protein
VNPNIATTPLPRSTLNGKVDTANYALTILSRPMEKTRLKFAFRQDERDNQTPQALVWFNSVAAGGGELRNPDGAAQAVKVLFKDIPANKTP